jgi:hypothetical protein
MWHYKTKTLRQTIILLFIFLTTCLKGQNITTIPISLNNSYEVSAIETVDSIFVVAWKEDRNSAPVTQDGTNKQVSLSVSNDYGLTWSTKKVFDDLSYDASGNPTLCSNAFGDMYLLYMTPGFSPWYAKFDLFKSIDHGITWNQLTTPVGYPLGSGIFPDLPHLILNNDTIDIVYTEYIFPAFTSTIKIIKSSDGGLTWSVPSILSIPYDTTCLGSCVKRGFDSTVLVSYAHYMNGPINFSKSINECLNFTVPDSIVGNAYTNCCNPSVTQIISSSISSKIGIIYYLPHGNYEIHYIGSDDYGITWHTPILISQFGSLASGAFDNNDRLYITYSEWLPNDSLSFNYKISDDNGVTFSSPVRLVGSQILSTIQKEIGAFSTTFYGSDNKIHDFWIDWRSNNFYLQHSFWETSVISSIENNLNIAVNVYPNPVTNKLNIEGTSPLQSVEVIDLLGTRIFYADVNERNTSIDFSQMTSGVYLLQIHTNNGILINKKIIK